MSSHNTNPYSNFNTFEKDVEITNGDGGGSFGRSLTKYTVYRRRDVRNLNHLLGYAVIMQQRIIIPNSTPYKPGQNQNLSYTNYPAVISNELSIKANNNATIELRNMFPRTLNSQVSTTESTADQNGNMTNHQSTTGSTNTNINTYSVGLGGSGGEMMDLPMWSIGLNWGHSHTDENSHMRSNTTGGGSSSDHSTSSASSMSIKDWSSYGYLDSAGVSPKWVWGQTYPWDVIQFNQTKDGTTIDLPDFVTDRLITSSGLVLPPSQLSMFGLDFSMTSGWLIDFPEGQTNDETLTIDHSVQCFTASHSANGEKISATLESEASASLGQFSSGAIDLSSYALNPILSSASSNGAAIGFSANPFTYPPTNEKTPFKIVSPANTIQVKGSGFSDGLTTSFSEPAKLTAIFKITDTTVNYAAHFIHWIGEGSEPVELTYTINGKFSGTLLASSTDGQGGENNISSISLRNTDFTSINFHDYLVVGTNTIDITVVPVKSGDKASYTLFAMGIGG